MNNLRETEKSLKRYLKSKISITMATVVGFMIAGTVSFGAENMTQADFDTLQENSYGKQFTTGETILTDVDVNGNEINHEKYMITVSEGAKLTIDGDSVVTTNGTNKYVLNITESSIVVNDGEITFNPNEDSGKVAVQVNGGAATSDKPATFINNNKVESSSNTKTAISLYKDATLENNGIIIGNIIGTDYNNNSGTQTIKLGEGSHIEGSIYLLGTGKNIVNIDGVKNGESEIIDIQSKDVEVTVNNSDVILTGNIVNEDGTAISVNNKDGNNTVVNNATIVAETGIGTANSGHDTSATASDRVITITNNGDITAKYYGIYNNGYFTKYNGININNAGNILVNNFVKDEETYDRPYYYATGIYQASGTYTETAGIIRNSGEVKVELTAEQYAELKEKYEETKGNMYLNIHGVRIHEHSEGYNTGDIIVNAFGGNGVVLSAGDTGANAVESFKDRYNYFENSGSIIVTGENGIGLALKNTTDAKMEAINKTAGKIVVEGVNVTGAKLVGKAELTNKGRIELVGKETTGSGIDIGWGATFVNEAEGEIVAKNNTGILIDVNSQHNAPTENIVTKVTNKGDIDAEVGITVQGPNNGVEGEGIQQIAKESVIEITNTDTATINATVYGIEYNAYTNIYNPVKVTNSGIIVVEGEDATTGIYVASRPNGGRSTIENEGKITVNNTNIDFENPYHTSIVGMRVHENTEGYNRKGGVITVSGNGAAGVAVTGAAIEKNQVTDDSKLKYTYFENEGTIDVSGEKSVGLLVRHDDTSNLNIDTHEVSVAAVNKGIIKATGEGAVGVKLSHYELENTTEGMKLVNLKFTNEGTIIATGEDSKAIYSEIDDLTINLAKNSHIEGIVDLTEADNNTLDINGVGLDGQEIITVSGDNDKIVVNNSNVVIEGNLINEAGTAISVNNKDGNNTVVNNATIVAETGIGVMNEGSDNSTSASERLVTITNNGDITAKYYGIYNNGYFTKYNGININNAGNILVNDFVKSESSGKPYYYATGIYQASGTYTTTAGIVENSGEIKVELTAEQYAELKEKYEETKGNMYLNIHGVRIHEHSEGYNTGDIIVNAFGGNGVVLSAGDTGANAVESFKDRYNYFENSGSIIVTGENGIGLALKNTTDAKMEAINKVVGVIEVNGNNSIGVKVNGNAIFTNTGTLVLGEDGTDKKAIVTLEGGKAINTGIIKVEGNELVGVTSKDDAFDKIFDGENISHSGLIVDKDGKAILFGADKIEGTLTGEALEEVIEEEEVYLGKATIAADGTTIQKPSLNVIDEVIITKAGDSGLVIDTDSVNLDSNGKIKVEGTEVALVEGEVNKSGEGEAIVIEDGTLSLVNTSVNGDIINGDIINVSAEGGENVEIRNAVVKVMGGTNSLHGNYTGLTFDFKNPIILNSLTASTSEKSQIVTLDSTSTVNKSNFEFSGNTGAQVQIGTDKNGNTAFTNGSENTFTGTSTVISTATSTGVSEEIKNNGDLLVKTENLSGDNVEVDLGDNTFINVGVTSDSDIYKVDTVLNEEKDEENTIVVLEYNKKLYENNTIINDINKEAAFVNEYFSQDVATREKQLDTLYANNIYSETARATYDMMKLNEESVLSLNADVKVGEWTTAGKAIYNNTEYTKTGTLGEYGSETETSGLMVGSEYGLNETTSVGVAFSGSIQNIDTDGGNTDGNVFYLGTYAKKQVGRLSLAAGLGYQYGDYDADNTAAEKISSSSYDVNAYSAYVEGRYGIDLGDNITFEPKVKLGYTYVDQGSVSDDYFRMSNSELSTFDTEIGTDLVKSVVLASGKLDVRFGASYVKAFGDTDDKFTGSFAGSTGSFDVLGAELSEDIAKFDLGIEVSNSNGVFYNLGGTLRVGDNNSRNYGVKLGAGYKF